LHSFHTLISHIAMHYPPCTCGNFRYRLGYRYRYGYKYTNTNTNTNTDHLATVPSAHVISAVIATRTLVIRATAWKTIPLITVGTLKVWKIGHIANARPVSVA